MKQRMKKARSALLFRCFILTMKCAHYTHTHTQHTTQTTRFTTVLNCFVCLTETSTVGPPHEKKKNM